MHFIRFARALPINFAENFTALKCGSKTKFLSEIKTSLSSLVLEMLLAKSCYRFRQPHITKHKMFHKSLMTTEIIIFFFDTVLKHATQEGFLIKEIKQSPTFN